MTSEKRVHGFVATFRIDGEMKPIYGMGKSPAAAIQDAWPNVPDCFHGALRAYPASANLYHAAVDRDGMVNWWLCDGLAELCCDA